MKDLFSSVIRKSAGVGALLLLVATALLPSFRSGGTYSDNEFLDTPSAQADVPASSDGGGGSADSSNGQGSSSCSGCNGTSGDGASADSSAGSADSSGGSADSGGGG